MSEPSEPLSTVKFLERITDKKEALKYAMETRRFEIELYWKRAAYFWTFIGATLAGYGALQASSPGDEKKNYLSVLLSSLGLVFSVGWFLVNKGSKKWQENWEKNVDLLEKEVVGQLFRTVWDKKEPDECGAKLEKWATGPGRFSGSRINQIISLFVAFLWIILLLGAIAEMFAAKASTWWMHFFSIIVVLAALIACRSFFAYGMPGEKSYWHHPFDGIDQSSRPSDQPK